ncbi:Mu transposase C-terminal domain-containing protein [Kingella kingae]
MAAYHGEKVRISYDLHDASSVICERDEWQADW